MKIISCYIENYGAISRKQYDFSDGVTCFLSANGTGKTTLASFIKAMFYGLPSYKANSKAFEDRQRFYPFNGGKFGGSLTFRFEGGVYRIERFFDKKSGARDETRVFRDGKEYGGFDGEIGRAVFGLDENAFERTVFLTAEELEITPEGGINAKLNADASATDCESLQNALKTLETRRKDIKADRGKGGLLEGEREKRTALSAEIAELKEIERGLAARYEERRALEEEIAALTRMANAENENRLLNERRAIYEGYLCDLQRKRERIAALGEIPDEERLRKLSDDCAELERYTELVKLLSSGDIAGSTANNGKRGGSSKAYIAAAAVAAALGLGGICACFFNLFSGFALVALSLIALFVDGFLYLKNRADGNVAAKTGDITGANAERAQAAAESAARLEREIISVLEGYGIASNGDIRGSINELYQRRKLFGVLSAEAGELAERAEEYANRFNLLKCAPAESADGAGERLEAARKRLALLDRLVYEDETNLERLPDREERRERTDGRIEYLKDRYELLTLTEKYLKLADGNIKERYVKPVKDRFDYYAESIRAELGGKLTMSEDFSLSFESGGEMRGEKHLSAGQRSVCALCLRLALIDNMYAEEKPFLVMDDPFVNLDGENLSGVVKVLGALAKRTQIIYFTCHECRKI